MNEKPSLPSRMPATAGRLVSPPSGAGVSITPKEIVGILRRRFWLILAVTILFTIGAMVIWYFERKYHPGYTSRGLVRCLMPIRPDLLEGGQTLPNDRIIALQTQSRAMDLRGEGFIRRVMQRTRVQSTTWFKSFGQDNVGRIDDFKDNFSVAPQRDSEFIVVSMTAPSPSEAQLILNEALAEFRQQMETMSESDLRGDLTALTNERDQVKFKIDQKRSDLARLISQANIPGMEQGKTVVSDEMDLMHLEKLRLQSQLQEAIYQRQLVDENGGASSQVMMAVDQSPVVMNLRNRVMMLTEQMDRLLNELGEDHQAVKQISASIQVIQQQLSDRQMQLQQQYSTSQKTMLDQNIQALQLELNNVNEQFENAVARQKDLEMKRANYFVAKEELDFLTKNLERFDRKIDETKVAMRSQGRVRVQIEEGHEPLQVSFPRWQIFFPAGLLLGLMVSVGLVFLLEFIDDTVKSPSDVNRYLHIPFLGMVPEYDEDDADQVTIEKLTALQPYAMFSDSYRQIRTNLFFSAPAEELKSILVTSASAGCGKTTTAVNLAITLANEGKRILLIDANFRRSAINHLFPTEGTPRGLSHILVGHATIADAIHPSGITGLDIIDSGPMPPNPADLLNSERMQELISRQQGIYDHLIFDGPPALLFSDSRILAGMCDGTLLVVHAHNTSRGMVQRMIRELNKPHIRVLGVVLNAIRPRKGGYFQETYESYNEYIRSDETEEVLALSSKDGSPDDGKDKTSG